MDFADQTVQKKEGETMKSIRNLAFLLVSFCIGSTHSAETVLTHAVTEGETALFLATVYYGKGHEYTKLLKANGVKRPEDIIEGMTIRIENPKFSKGSPEFADRYDRLWEKRQKALGLNAGKALPHARVVIPSDKIRKQDNTPHLPFVDVREPADEGKNPGKGH